MAVYIRLDDAVRARLRGDGGGTSSGSDHDASACLSGLVQAFLETDAAAGAGDDAGGPAPKGRDGYDSDDADGAAEAAAASVRELLDPPAAEDPFRIRLAAAVSAALDAEAPLRGHGAAFRRAVMRRLRAAGYDAGVCRSRWETCGNLTAGTYEYVDVVVPAAGKAARYIVDADFRAGLQVARATAEYAVVVAAVPARAVVAREEAVGRAVRVAADAARRSLRAHGLHVPPWRKSRYMLAKWLGPYKRSPSSSSPASGAMPAPGTTGLDVIKCRAVGFFPSQTAAPAARIK
ncbi:hypothetical protein CFC21_037533 [Triticum aestivum]|uniref:Uncharacterized protein n=3 Tax=Triticum TaxID=4564 RepID=A0A9R0VSS2_TRITD|nr:uncharacterized protein LOC123059001 [Triticum aestivum]KAF7025335.1 hypothetical protein CFC21_037533 [Triticum aestivum]VAH67613.1 unnamed protein product [Triticum turgidum subsp. durum]